MERYRVFFVLLLTLLMAGCGGGGGGTAASGAGTATKAVLVLSLDGVLPPGSAIGAVDVTVALPPGVTPQIDAVTGEPLPGVVVPSGKGAGSTQAAKYNPASSTIRIGLINSSGFTTGEFLTLNLNVSGTAPSVTSFNTTGLSVVDLSSAVLNGLAAALTLQLN